jgi:hypothetical protein
VDWTADNADDIVEGNGSSKGRDTDHSCEKTGEPC